MIGLASFDLASWMTVVKVIAINAVLSADNAVIIALACQRLPRHQRVWGLAAGAGAAIVVRTTLTTGIAYLLAIPFLSLVSALVLFWIAISLITPDRDGPSPGIDGASGLWNAIRIVVVADAIMSLDNMVSVAAVARADFLSIVVGLATSIPVVMACSALIMTVMIRFPVIIWASGALLGWIAGDMMAADPAVEPWFTGDAAWLTRAAGAVLVVSVGLTIRQTTGSNFDNDSRGRPK
ncbi:MAG: TerC family protein [Alphaproteobacteria bacterium]|nr:TerC family protein [Alphaproteobacteria bacterium]